MAMEKKKKQKKTAMETALRHLAPRMRTEQELRRYLRDREYPEAEIEEVCQSLREAHYLDDAAYAEAYTRYALEKHRGRARILRELRERGVDAETARFACEDVLYEQGTEELAEALAVAYHAVYGAWPETRDLEELREGLRAPEDEGGETREPLEERQLAAIARRLDGLGYGTSTITRTLEILRG